MFLEGQHEKGSFQSQYINNNRVLCKHTAADDYNQDRQEEIHTDGIKYHGFSEKK